MRGNLVLNPNQVLFSSELAARGIGLILKVLLNPISGRNVSHPCLISTWPKEWCTIMCMIVGHKNLGKVHVPHVVSMVEEPIIMSRRPHARIVRPRQWHIARGGLVIEKKLRKWG